MPEIEAAAAQPQCTFRSLRMDEVEQIRFGLVRAFKGDITVEEAKILAHLLDVPIFYASEPRHLFE